MNKVFSVLLGIVFSLALQSCSPQKLPPGEFQRQWMMVAYKDYSKAFLTESKAQIDLSPVKSIRYGAFMGCNRMFLSADFFKNGTVKFSDAGSTMMYCEGRMDLESDFAKDLPTMTKYKIEGHNLTLSNEKGIEMKFIAADWD